MTSNSRQPGRRWRLSAIVAVLLMAAVSGASLAEGGAHEAAASGRVLRVGPTRELRNPSDAARVAKDGDVIEIDAGIYRGDVAVWRRNNLTLRGVGGMAHLAAEGRSAQGKAIWVIKGKNTRVEYIEFSGARVRDKNGAGIRLEGPGLTVSNAYFHDNENGVLTSPNRESDVVIEYSEFARNGHPNGYAHNMYIGEVRSFTLRYSYVHHAVIGSQVKTRALTNRIYYNRIMDESDGRGNYSIDISNGGIAYIVGNVIQQGRLTENYHLIAFAPEGGKKRQHRLFVINNTMVNDRSSGRFIWNRTPTNALVYNNVFVGAGKVVRGKMTLVGNVVQSRLGLRQRGARLLGREPDLGGADGSRDNRFVSDVGLMTRFRYDYRLRPDSPAIDAGRPLSDDAGRSLLPDFQYVHPRSRQPRTVIGAAIDAGAFEAGSPAPVPRPR